MKKTLFAAAIAVVFSAQAFAAQTEQVSDLNAKIQAAHANWVAKDMWTSHLSKAEAQHLLGLQKAPSQEAQFKVVSTGTHGTLPAALDWRNKDGKNWISPILNQGNCGSCVAFASIGTMESQYIIATGLPNFNIQLSPQNLFECGGGMCEMGWMPEMAAQFLQQTGVVDEACQPYLSGATGQDTQCTDACGDSAQRTYKIGGYTTPTSGTLDVDAVKQALQNGPLVTTLTVYADFMSYSSGVYKHVTGDALGGHAVSIVGYDDSKQAFIVRNSWGTDWGDQGFIYVAYDDISGIGGETWSFQIPKMSGAVSVQSPRDAMAFSGSVNVQANSTFSLTNSMTISVLGANHAAIATAQCTSANCNQSLDMSAQADGKYQVEVTAMDPHGTPLGTSSHQYFYLANKQPTLSVSFVGNNGLDLTKPLTDRIEFAITTSTSSVPMTSIEFHRVGPDGKEVVVSAPTVIPSMTMGWRTNLVPNGKYQIWFVGHLKTNAFDQTAVTPHMTVTTQN